MFNSDLINQRVGVQWVHHFSFKEHFMGLDLV